MDKQQHVHYPIFQNLHGFICTLEGKVVRPSQTEGNPVSAQIVRRAILSSPTT